ncbi:MAG: tetratricopeptide repeat protein [Candidatus Delongbacteria bacterium]|nr:tetratricopeptide repeat protein [Candidatus Delongbacteria bacterium]MBN2821081.1 tetratricopeptide repeat protein [Bacteroidales bacterium]
MKNLAFAIIVLIAFSCNHKSDKESEVILDNEELVEIYKADQADRQTQPIDWNIVSKRDSLREVRIYELLDSNKVRTSLDYHNAAMIFQHGRDSVAYAMAVKLMKKSIELDSTANKWLLAAAIDRYLLSKGEPQIYGTQYWKMKDQPWELREIDTTKITDAERIEYGVETLAQQKVKVKRMNSKKLSDLLNDGKNIDELVQFIKQEDIKSSEYDLSESGINSFGYQIMSQGLKEDALKIFKLNTELYPEGFNTFDSYGECLLELGDKENAIIAYRKSLELNPENKNAEKVLMKIE